MIVKKSDFKIEGTIDEDGETSWRIVFIHPFAFANDAEELVRQFIKSGEEKPRTFEEQSYQFGDVICNECQKTNHICCDSKLSCGYCECGCKK